MTRKIYAKTTGRRTTTTLAMLLVMLVGAGTAFAQGTFIKSGTTMTITSGTTVFESGSLTLDAPAAGNSTLTNNGELIIKGNLVNNNTSDNSLGTGTINFNGTVAQTISGPNVFGTLQINNATGVSFTGTLDSKVTTALNLTLGRLTLGSRNLLLGSGCTITGNTPSATNMVVATSAGELRKEWPGNGSFTFPVGDNTVTAEYSPVTLNFTAGTYPANNYIGVTLVNSAYNPAVYTGSYLSRYWVVTNASPAPITGFACNATFQYADGDITGTEAEIYTTKVAPDPVVTYAVANTSANQLSATGLITFSTFTGTKGAIAARLAIMLQGPFSAGAMTTTLTTLPLGVRTDDTKFPQQQPYNGAPWNYSGTENITSIPANTVDWVLVDLRKGTSPGTATFAARRAALLKTDGTITDIDGTSGLRFFNVAKGAGEDLYIVVRHRNHMPVLAQVGATQNGSGEWTYDFTSGSDQFYPNTGTGCVQLSTSPVIWGMLSGDADNSGQVYLNDLNTYWVPYFGSTSKYIPGDFNLDKNVYLNDNNTYWVSNFGQANILP